MRIIHPLEPGKYYHIFNRGINSINLFTEHRNYNYFISKYVEYCSPIVETYCYALLKNHFHFLIRVKENVFITRKDNQQQLELKAEKQLSHFFNSYAQAYNKANKRHGGLFENPFRRIEVDSNEYCRRITKYIHFNPQHHHFTNDFRNWEFTSWHDLISGSDTFLEREKVLDWFGGKDNFIEFHLLNKTEEYNTLINMEF